MDSSLTLVLIFCQQINTFFNQNTTFKQRISTLKYMSKEFDTKIDLKHRNIFRELFVTNTRQTNKVYIKFLQNIPQQENYSKKKLQKLLFRIKTKGI